MLNSSVSRRGVWAAAWLLVLSLPAVAAAQKPSLGELAKKEEERRKSLKRSERVLTNKDLPPVPPRPPAPAAASPGDVPEQKPAEPTAEPGAEKAAGEQQNETWWRERMTRAREGLRRSESFLEALQTRVNVLSADFVSRDDPAQRAKIGEDRQKALAEMERVSADMLMFKKQIEDIEEDARKAGVPPGWLR